VCRRKKVLKLCLQLEAHNQQLGFEVEQAYKEMITAGNENSNTLGIKVRSK
jgi:hypothetical protein